MPCGLVVGHGTEGTVGGERVLGQVVGADGYEVGHFGDLVGHQRDRGHFGHGAYELQSEAFAEFDEVIGLMLVGDHRRHDPQVRVGGRVRRCEGLQLAFEHIHVGAQGAQAAQAQRGVRLVFRREERQWLVGSGVEHADHDLLARELAEQFGVGLGLLFDARRFGVADEQEFRAEQPHAFGAVFQCLGRIGRLAHVREQRNGMAVFGGARVATQLLGGRGTGTRGLGVRDFLVGWIDDDFALGGVDDDVLAVLQVLRLRCGYHRDDAARTGEDGGMRGRAALRGDDGEGFAHVQGRGVGGRQVFGDEYERGLAGRQARGRHAHQIGDDALADVVQVGGAFGLVSADRTEHVLHRGETFQHRAFGGLSLIDEIRDGLRQRRIRREHGDRLQNRRGLLGSLITVGGFVGATVQVGVHQGERVLGTRDFGFRRDVFGAWGVRWFRQWSGHADDRTDSDATTDANTFDVHRNSLSFPWKATARGDGCSSAKWFRVDSLLQ